MQLRRCCGRQYNAAQLAVLRNARRLQDKADATGLNGIAYRTTEQDVFVQEDADEW